MIINLDIDLTMLPGGCVREARNGHRYLKLTVGTMKQADKFGNDLTIWVTQTKEERDSRAERAYVGKGKTFGEKKQPDLPITRGNIKSDLPF